MASFKEPFLMRSIFFILTLLLLAIPSIAANIEGKVVKIQPISNTVSASPGSTHRRKDNLTAMPPRSGL